MAAIKASTNVGQGGEQVIEIDQLLVCPISGGMRSRIAEMSVDADQEVLEALLFADIAVR
jgi:hypothetical protein